MVNMLLKYILGIARGFCTVAGDIRYQKIIV